MVDSSEDVRLELQRLRQENARLRKLLDVPPCPPKTLTGPTSQELLEFPAPPLPTVTRHSSAQEKVALFRALFRGREDVYAQFWVSERTGKQGYSPASEEPWSAARKGQPKKYFPLTDQVVQDHLEGVKTVGVFPLLKNHTCWFLACDFDGTSWTLDASAFLSICQQYNIPAYLERSRSGQGGHIWIFFASPAAATKARQLGMRLLRETMVLRGEMDLASYDRFFPNQDFMPKGGFGNLIALPLQKAPRALGNTEFLNLGDSELHPWTDQWASLSQVRRLTPDQVDALLEVIPPIAVGPGTQGTISNAVRQRYPPPPHIRATFGAMVSIEKSGVPPWLLSQLKHLASLHNPQFYQRERLRLSTFRIPRFIKCYEEDVSHIHLPRGISEELNALCETAGSRLSMTEARPTPKRLSLKFLGQLTSFQRQAMRQLLAHEMGVLVAPPGAGKTIMGCFAVARRNVPTLILSHRKPILEQWRAQLMATLGLSSRDIGQVGGGRNKQRGVVDLGMIQSLARLDDLEPFFSAYGFLIVDECHHLPAFTFEAAVKRAPVRCLLGLTATPYRRDGLQDIITMQCGPIRHKMQDAEAGFLKQVIVRETPFACASDNERSIQEVFRDLVNDRVRNELIQQDVRQAVSRGRRCLILSQWREHCRLLAEGLAEAGKAPFVLEGTLGKKDRVAMLQRIQAAPREDDLVVIATGQYLGEGFDCPQIDTLFLAFPISFKGKLVQYVGRALRTYEGKERVAVYDYADVQVPVLKAMHVRRLKTYKALGFSQTEDTGHEMTDLGLFQAERHHAEIEVRRSAQT